VKLVLAVHRHFVILFLRITAHLLLFYLLFSLQLLPYFWVHSIIIMIFIRMVISCFLELVGHIILLLIALVGFATPWIWLQLLAILARAGSTRIRVRLLVRFVYLLNLPPFVVFEIMGCCYEIFLAAVGLHQGHLVVYISGRCLLNFITWLDIAQRLFIKWRLLSQLN